MKQEHPPLRIERATAAQSERLRVFAEQTFRAAFQHRNNPDDFEAYMAKAFSPAHFQAEFDHPGSEFWLAWHGDVLSGYCKINTDKTPEEPLSGPSVEIERIYVSAEQQGQGLGARLLDFCKHRAQMLGVRWLWLGVWEENTGAIAFYRRHGFEEFGSHDFWVGEDRQTDLLMRWGCGQMKYE